MSDGVNWVGFPLWEEMDFSKNCTAYGNFLASFIMPNPWIPSESLGGSFALAWNYFWESAPSNFTFPANYTAGDMVGTIEDWYGWNIYNYYNDTDGLYYMTDEFYNLAIWDPKEVCPAEFCKAVGYTGNADLTGIGVYMSYYAEACLATLYLIAFTVWTLKKSAQRRALRKGQSRLDKDPEVVPEDGTKKRKLSLGERTIDSFRGSVDAFLSAAMMMSIVMLVAAIYTSAVSKEERSPSNPNQDIPTGSALYDMVLSLLASTFSVFPVLLLYALMGRHNSKRRHAGGAVGIESAFADRHRVWMRRCVLVVIWILGCAEVYLAPRGEIDYDLRHNAAEDQYFCDQRGGVAYWRGMKAAQWLVIGAPLLWLTLTLFVTTGFWIPGVANKRWVKRWRGVWRLGIAWFNLLFMWGLLAYFTVLRHRIIVTSGGLDNEDKWSFGQILALATWVPVLAEFVYTFIWGIEESLDAHLPSGFHIARHDSDMSRLSIATAGFNPFDDKDNQPLINPRSTYASSDAASTINVEMASIYSGYSGAAGVKRQPTIVESPKQEQTPYFDVTAWNAGQTEAWNEWRSTGW